MSRVHRIRIGSVALGVVIDKASFIILAAVLSAILSTSSTAFSIVALLLGTFCTTLGAYVAAARAQAAFLTHGLLVAAAAFAISFARYLAFSMNPPDDPGAIHSLPWELAGWSLVVIAGALGGYLAQRKAAESAV